MAQLIQINLNKILVGTPFETRRVVGVALSGGRDSVALFYALKQAGENIVAINVEHGIRGENSLKDSEFVKEFCKAQGVKLYSFSVDVPTFAKAQGYTIEQAARVLRYQVFDKAVEDGLCDIVAIAHHSDDLAETLLMRILRGTGTKGLVGMRAFDGRYIRPLLDFTREDINAYIEANNLPYVDDETNDDLAFTRNYLRAELARLKERYPDMEAAFARLSRVASETEEYIDSVLPELTVDCGEVRIKTADCENSFVLKRLVVKGAKLLGVDKDIEEKHLNSVVELSKNESGKRLDLTHGLVAHKEQDGIVLTRESKQKTDVELRFETGDFEELGVSVESVPFVTSEQLRSGEALYLDFDKIPTGAVVRARRDGDYIEKFGGGTKSVGDFLTDKKIPLRLRDALLVVAKGSEVYAIFGVEISAKVKIDGNTKHVVKLAVKK